MRVLDAPEPGFLSEDQRARAEAIFDALLPRDPSSYYEIQGWRDLYTQALDALDVADLGREEVTAVLAKLQRGEAEGVPEGIDQKRLFTTMRNHCIEGCFADPRWHGNRDAVMWRWLGSHGPAQAFERSQAEVGHGV